MKELIVICGPTASGKTDFAIQLAKKLNTEIISADSRQFFREMNIGTAKPTKEELKEAKHHFINSLSIQEVYSAGDFERDALNLLEKLFKKYDQIILAGGSGLYIKAVCEGFHDLPQSDPELRTQLKKKLKEQGSETLFLELSELDPEYAKSINAENPQRLLRALEVIKSSGQTMTHLQKHEKEKRPFRIRKYGINWERQQLYKRINKRVDIMLEEGLEAEARDLYPYRELNALQTVGYSEFFDYFGGKIDREEAIRLIKRNTRRFAKRQLTWFRKDEEIEWLQAEEVENFPEEFK